MWKITNAKHARLPIRILSSGNLLPNSANLYRLLRCRARTGVQVFLSCIICATNACWPTILVFRSTKSRSWPQLGLKAIQPLADQRRESTYRSGKCYILNPHRRDEVTRRIGWITPNWTDASNVTAQWTIDDHIYSQWCLAHVKSIQTSFIRHSVKSHFRNLATSIWYTGPASPTSSLEITYSLDTCNLSITALSVSKCRSSIRIR